MKRHVTADKHGSSTIRSLYCDTPDYLLVRRSLEKPLYKEKLRLRSYGPATDGDTIFIELKKKYDSVVYKRRIAMPLASAMKYLYTHHPADNSQIAREIDYCISHYRQLVPKILLTYEREAFYGIENDDLRITFDRNILWRDQDLNLTNDIYGTPILAENQVLMEIKTGSAIPLWLVKILSKNHIYKTSFYKYGTAYQMMLWNRTGGTYHYA